jgi:hypothetical protein
MDLARRAPIPQRVNWELSLGFASVYGHGKVSAAKPRPWEEVYKVEVQKLAVGFPGQTKSA